MSARSFLLVHKGPGGQRQAGQWAAWPVTASGDVAPTILAASAWGLVRTLRSSPGKNRARVAVGIGDGVRMWTCDAIGRGLGLPAARQGDLGGLGGAVSAKEFLPGARIVEEDRAPCRGHARSGATMGISLPVAVTLVATDLSQSLASICAAGASGAAWIAVCTQRSTWPQRSKIERHSCAIASDLVMSIGASVA